jgi:predicted TIM-barrel fold metal-dependent hydrolase
MAISEALRIREQLKHPIVDGDGHWLEPMPIWLEFLRDVGGPEMVDQYQAVRRTDSWPNATVEERMAKRLRRMQPWIGNAAGAPSDTLTRATAMLPALMRERMEELGIDFAIIYPTSGLGAANIAHNEVRRAWIRAYNLMTAEIYAPHKEVFAPAAIVPTTTVTEAVEEAEFCVRELGYKVIMVRTALPRPIRAYAGDSFHTTFEDGSRKMPYYIDTLGLDNDENWDPFWATCVELRLAVTTHGGSHEWPDRKWVNNFTANHTGHFAQANHAATKGMFLGGVTRRFPTLQCAFLEGGVGYAVNLLHDLVGHYEKLNLEAIEANLCPQRLDAARLRDYIVRYGDERSKAWVDDIMGSINFTGTMDEAVDDFALAGINSKEELLRLFSSNFYFGCEADDPVTAWAFDPRMGARLKALFSSDIGHFDVPDITKVVPEAYEMVEDGLITEDDFGDFTFSNAVLLHGLGNPDFFRGTTIERQAAEILAGSRQPVAAA